MTGPVIAGVDGGAAGADALVLGGWLAARLKVPLIVAAVPPTVSITADGRSCLPHDITSVSGIVSSPSCCAASTWCG